MSQTALAKPALKSLTALLLATTPLAAHAKAPAALKTEAATLIDGNAKLVQEMKESDIYSPFSAHQYGKDKDVQKLVDDDNYKSKKKIKK